MTELQHISEKPWADYTAADYTPEQYKAACLVVRGDGSTKDQCKLPVKTPNGALNRNGVHAAAAALAGARGGVDLTSDERASAKKKLSGYYKQLNEEPPSSLSHSGMRAFVEAVIDDVKQSGVKGMHWGVRRTPGSTSSGDRGTFELTGKSTPKPGQDFTHRGQSFTTLSNAAKTGKNAFVVNAKKTSMVTPEQRKTLNIQGKNYVQRAMGDKEFWQKAVAVGVVGGTGLAAAALGPAFLPVGAIAAAGGAAHFSAVVSSSTLAATRAGSILNGINYRRRVRSARRVAVHSELMHVDGPTVEEVYNSMTSKQKTAATTLIAAAVNGVDVSGEADLNDAWSTMSDDQHAAVYFLAAVADVDQENQTVSHSDLVSLIIAQETDAQQHGIRGMRWGVRRDKDSATGRVEQTGNTGLVSRSSSADQIAQDRITSKLAKGGVQSVSNADIQAYTRRLQLQSDLKRITDQQSAAEKAKADGFVKSFVKRQANRQTDRIINATVDIAVEKGLEAAGLKIGKKGGNPDVADTLVKVSSRIKPKKGK